MKTTDITDFVRLMCGFNHYKQKDLARITGISTTNISRKLAGKRPWTLEDVEKIANAFGFVIDIGNQDDYDTCKRCLYYNSYQKAKEMIK